MQIFMLGLSIFSCVLFVVETYQPNGGTDNIAIAVRPSSV